MDIHGHCIDSYNRGTKAIIEAIIDAIIEPITEAILEGSRRPNILGRNQHVRYNYFPNVSCINNTSMLNQASTVDALSTLESYALSTRDLPF